MAVIEQVLMPERASDGKPAAFGELAQCPTARTVPAAAADQQQRTQRMAQSLDHLGHLRLRGCDRDRIDARRIFDIGLTGQHVFGQRQHHRSRPARKSHSKRMSDVLGNALDAIDLRGPFSDAAVHPSIVDFLERFAIGHIASDLADQRDHRRRVLARRVDAHRGIGGTGTPRHQCDPRTAGELAVGVRHVRGAALLPADDKAQPVGDVHQRVEHGKIAFPRDPESMCRPLRQQVGHEDFTAGARCHRGTRWGTGPDSTRRLRS